MALPICEVPECAGQHRVLYWLFPAGAFQRPDLAMRGGLDQSRNELRESFGTFWTEFDGRSGANPVVHARLDGLLSLRFHQSAEQHFNRGAISDSTAGGRLGL